MEVTNTSGRRKTSVSRIYMKSGKGVITINKRPLEVYFPSDILQIIVNQPFNTVDLAGKYDVDVNVFGGGLSGQAEATRLAIAKALCELDAEHRPTLKKEGFLTRDPRMVERKKYGKKKARRASNSVNVKIYLSNNMAKVTTKELLEAGVHFGHLTRKWDPRMAPHIFMERNGIHIIDLNKTASALENAKTSIANIARSGRKIMFVATKKQAHALVSEEAKRLKMPFVTERWLGGMLTNFSTVRKSIKRMGTIEKLEKDPDFEKNIAKRERLMLSREKAKLERVIGGIAELNRLPAALFVIDVKKEHLAVKEAHKLGLPIFGLVDTNSNPDDIDYAIPGNDDSAKAIEVIVKHITSAIEEGLNERKKEKDADKKEEEVAAAATAETETATEETATEEKA